MSESSVADNKRTEERGRFKESLDTLLEVFGDVFIVLGVLEVLGEQV